MTRSVRGVKRVKKVTLELVLEIANPGRGKDDIVFKYTRKLSGGLDGITSRNLNSLLNRRTQYVLVGEWELPREYQIHCHKNNTVLVCGFPFVLTQYNTKNKLQEN